ncbi:hypothetical protein BGZ49_008143 [Haplosporangium sp. Z 27]|nr:hypothetical protein BGZ49_008143 [Haplosporangium sp. Z 27]
MAFITSESNSPLDNNQQQQYNSQDQMPQDEDTMSQLKTTFSPSFLSNNTTTNNNNNHNNRNSTNITTSSIKSLYSPPPPANNTHSSALPSHQDNNRHSHNFISQRPLSDLSTTSSSPPPSISSIMERCEALESELSELRNKLHRSEQSSTVREKRLSQAQIQSSNTQQSLHTLKQQHEMTLIQLSKVQAEATSSRTRAEEKEKENQQLKSQVQSLTSELREVTLDRDSLSLEMAECHTDNAKFLKRLRTSNDKVDRLQDENRHLIEQLRELRARNTELSEMKTRLSETLDRERHRAGQAALELEGVVARYKREVERLQDLVLALGHKQVEVQSQLAYLQQQAQKQPISEDLNGQKVDEESQPAESSSNTPPNAFNDLLTSSHKPVSSSVPTESIETVPGNTTQQYGDLNLGEGALSSIMASVAASSHSRRSKPARRFTINSSHTEAPLTLEQRKGQLLMDQITVLQRGYDTLREEKATMELQLEMMQRQHLYHQQHRHNRRHSQRKALGQRQAPSSSSNVISSPSTGASLELASPIKSQEQLPGPESSEDNVDIRKEKDLNVQGALASLESKTDSRDAQTIISSDDLNHLNEKQHSSSPAVSGDFVSAVSSLSIISPRSSPTRSSSSSSSVSSVDDELSQKLYTEQVKLLPSHQQQHHHHGHIPRVFGNHDREFQQLKDVIELDNTDQKNASNEDDSKEAPSSVEQPTQDDLVEESNLTTVTIFSLNLDSSTIELSLSELGGRITNTSQLAYCLSFLQPSSLSDEMGSEVEGLSRKQLMNRSLVI